MHAISQAASSQRSLADNKRDITLYITTLGSHKHNKSRAKKIKHAAQMEERRCGNAGVKAGSGPGPGGRRGNMVCQKMRYLERELVHGVDFIEVVHYEVQ